MQQDGAAHVHGTLEDKMPRPLRADLPCVKSISARLNTSLLLDHPALVHGATDCERGSIIQEQAGNACPRAPRLANEVIVSRVTVLVKF